METENIDKKELLKEKALAHYYNNIDYKSGET